MGIKVHGIWVSGATRTVLAVLHEKNVDYEFVVVDMKNRAHKTPEFLAMNPFGKVPVFQDGDIILFESRAIARYIANKFEGQGTSLLGSTATERALVEQWMEVEAQNYTPPCSNIVSQLFINKVLFGKEADEAIVATNEAKLNDVLDIYETQLSKTKYLAGDFFSLADLGHYAPIDYLVKHTGKSDLVTSRKNVAAWWEDISSRPSWEKVTSGA